MDDSTVAAWRGRVIRAWRENAGLRPSELARATGVSPAALTMWETGQRKAGKDDLERLQPALHMTPLQQRAMTDMWAAAGTATDGMPRTGWAHNFPPPSRPVWLWVRPERPGTASGRAWWAEPFQGRFDVEVGSAGLIVTAPTSIPNPALHVTLDRAGWVDFGVGVIPEGVARAFGIVLLDGPTMMDGVSPVDSPPIDDESMRYVSVLLRFLQRRMARLGIGWHTVAPHLGIARSDRAPHALDGDQWAVPAAPVPGVRDDDESGRAFSITREQIRRLREARGLSRAEAAALMSEYDPDSPVSATMLERVETGGRIPKVDRFISRLDSALANDGRTGVETVFDSNHFVAMPRRMVDGYTVPFPWYWVGPIWIRVDSAASTPSGVLDLTWGHWHRTQRIQPGYVVTTRQAELDAPDLLVRVPPGWRITAGTGAIPTALDVNGGWWPRSPRAAAKLLAENLDAIGERITFRRRVQ